LILIQHLLTSFKASISFMLQVMSDGVYNVVIMYTSIVEATFKLAVGDYKSLLDSSSPSITAQLPAMVGGAFDMCTRRVPPMSRRQKGSLDTFGL